MLNRRTLGKTAATAARMANVANPPVSADASAPNQTTTIPDSN